jgi:hypothetical protein
MKNTILKSLLFINLIIQIIKNLNSFGSYTEVTDENPFLFSTNWDLIDVIENKTTCNLQDLTYLKTNKYKKILGNNFIDNEQDFNFLLKTFQTLPQNKNFYFNKKLSCYSDVPGVNSPAYRLK